MLSASPASTLAALVPPEAPSAECADAPLLVLVLVFELTARIPGKTREPVLFSRRPVCPHHERPGPELEALGTVGAAAAAPLWTI